MTEIKILILCKERAESYTILATLTNRKQESYVNIPQYQCEHFNLIFIWIEFPKPYIKVLSILSVKMLNMLLYKAFLKFILVSGEFSYVTYQ